MNALKMLAADLCAFAFLGAVALGLRLKYGPLPKMPEARCDVCKLTLRQCSAVRASRDSRLDPTCRNVLGLVPLDLRSYFREVPR